MVAQIDVKLQKVGTVQTRQEMQVFANKSLLLKQMKLMVPMQPIKHVEMVGLMEMKPAMITTPSTVTFRLVLKPILYFLFLYDFRFPTLSLLLKLDLSSCKQFCDFLCLFLYELLYSNFVFIKAFSHFIDLS